MKTEIHSQPNKSKECYISAKNVTKCYPGVVAVNDVSIDIASGMVNAVVGENGAGKSTLMKLLAGIEDLDKGELYVNGQKVRFRSPREAADAGVSMVHQEMQIIPTLSIADNFMLLRTVESNKIHRGSTEETNYVKKHLDKVGLTVNPRWPASKLSPAESQLLSIARTVSLGTQVLILDEPTSSLSSEAAETVLNLVETLRLENRAVIYISHRLGEVTRLGDVITVMRDGEIAAQVPRNTPEDDIIRVMVDRPVSLYASARSTPGDKCVLAVQNLATDMVRNLSFELHKGEILGFSGLVGSGRSDAAFALCSMVPIRHGKITLDDKLVRFRNPRDAKKNGVSIVPEDRKNQGIVPNLDVHENLHVGHNELFSRSGMFNRQLVWNASRELVRRFGIKLSSLGQSITTLSGGNQQKVVLARGVEVNPAVLILDEPTRGIDVGAKEEIHQIIIELAKSGTAIILISSELDEVLALSHRVAVFYEGTITCILGQEDATPETVMAHASGNLD